ncbi:MAG: polysaccharide deacetylase family protein [Desulfococcaceae bacterium]
MSGRDGSLRAIVSIHDVMPETLEPVGRILDLLERAGVSPATMLVVPGRDWSGRQIALLRSWESAGCILAGHGWVHQVFERKTLFHQLHGRFLSRGAAEHLSLDRCAARALVRRCHHWFGEHDLTPPDLYVPPAWAMGPLRRRDLSDLPFESYETAGGIYMTSRNRFCQLPLAGFEADIPIRAAILRPWNQMNVAVARSSRLPLRIAIHPFDLELKLRDEIGPLLSAVDGWLDYRRLDLSEGGTPP